MLPRKIPHRAGHLTGEAGVKTLYKSMVGRESRLVQNYLDVHVSGPLPIYVNFHCRIQKIDYGERGSIETY